MCVASSPEGRTMEGKRLSYIQNILRSGRERERLHGMQEVAGSNPAGSTMNRPLRRCPGAGSYKSARCKFASDAFGNGLPRCTTRCCEIHTATLSERCTSLGTQCRAGTAKNFASWLLGQTGDSPQCSRIPHCLHSQVTRPRSALCGPGPHLCQVTTRKTRLIKSRRASHSIPQSRRFNSPLPSFASLRIPSSVPRRSSL